MRRLCLSCLLLFLCGSLFAQQPDRAARWADSVMARMSLRSQVGQLMIARVPSNMTEKQQRKFVKSVLNNEVGGICFFAGTSQSQSELTCSLQAQSKVPLLVCIDGETGLGMRLTDVTKLPCQMLLGAMPASADSLVFEMGMLMGRQCRNMGVHVNFSPVADININPRNPVIGLRSFGQDKELVARKASLIMRGIQQEGVMAVAKHFPGHGDTEADSHVDLPIVKHSMKYIDTVDLYPFRRLIADGVGGVMVGHLHIPVLDTSKTTPSSLSPAVATRLLRGKLGYEGIVFTDGIDMKAVTKYFPNGNAELMALRAGNDMVLLPPDIEKAIDSVCDAAKDDARLRTSIRRSCRRVLMAKYRYVVSPSPAKGYIPSEAELSYDIALRGVTLMRADCHAADVRYDVTASNIDATLAALDTLPDSLSAAICLFASPYQLRKIMPKVDKMPNQFNIIVAYQNNAAVRRAVDTLMKGSVPFSGRLPVAAGGYEFGHGLDAFPPLPPVLQPLQKCCPLIAQKIDSVVYNGINRKAYPGCQLLVARRGEILYNRCYGRLTYDSGAAEVTPYTRYDMASVTKMAATTMAVMRLVGEGRIDLDSRLSHYLRYLRFTDKQRMTVREVLSHCAGLQAGVAGWRAVLFDSTLVKAYASDTLPDVTDQMLKAIVRSKRIKEKHKMVYSDLGFILLGDLVKKVSGVSLDRYVDSCFYAPLHMEYTCFNPLLHGVPKENIAPTELDSVYRGGVICGTVHDPNAAAMGGVAGHAGLFSTASDMAVLAQMLLDGGRADSLSLIPEGMVRLFNTRYFANEGNRRALGFDKPLFNPTKNGNTAVSATQNSYGHTGFTGTMLWIDPDNDLIYIFISNRVHPKAHPNLLASYNIRTDIQQLIYDALKEMK